MSKYFLQSLAFYAAGHIFVWFQLYSHVVWEWWQNKPIHAALAFGIPASICFWYGTKITLDITNEAWAARMLGFGMSYMTFPVMTWYFLNESMFTIKTLICVFLSFLIVGIQIGWK